MSKKLYYTVEDVRKAILLLTGIDDFPPIETNFPIKLIDELNKWGRTFFYPFTGDFSNGKFIEKDGKVYWDPLRFVKINYVETQTSEGWIFELVLSIASPSPTGETIYRLNMGLNSTTTISIENGALIADKNDKVYRILMSFANGYKMKKTKKGMNNG